MSNDLDAEHAVRVLLRHIGDDPDRPELAATPARVARLLRQAFAGYAVDLNTCVGALLPADASDPAPVYLCRVPFESYCEHHMVPFTGTAHLAYLPGEGLAGIGGLLRLLNACTARLQLQERLTDLIAHTLHRAVGARGTAVMLQAVHRCTRADGTLPEGTVLVTRRFTGAFIENAALREEFFSVANRA